MDLSIIIFLGLLGGVALLRVVELSISRRNQRVLTGKGVRKIVEPHFKWMVLLHTGILIGAAAEVVFLHRPFIPALCLSMGILFLLANAARWWVIRTLGRHWNVEVMESARLGVVSSGPFRFIRHPNYTAVIVELAALPLIHAAWLTALFGSAAHAWVISRRLAVEEAVLLADPAYRSAMAQKCRFVPGIF